MLDCVETSAVWKLSEFGMLSVDPRAARKAGREKSCNNQHSAKDLSHGALLSRPALPAIASSGELVRGLEDSSPSTFSIEIGNERNRVPVA